MKKVLLLLLLLISGLSTTLWAQPTVNFRITNPRILNTYNITYADYCDNLAIDIELSVSAGTSYYHMVELHTTCDTSAVTDIDWRAGALCTVAGTTYAWQTWNLTNGNINLSVANNSAVTLPWASREKWTTLTTSWQTLGTILLRITNITAVQNCTWLPALMAVSLDVQKEKTFASPGPGPSNSTRDYAAISTTGTPIANLYLGRIYCNSCLNAYGDGWDWTQVGGGVPNQNLPYIDWTTGVNTSIWDSIAAGGAGTITGTNCQANNLRIHAGARLDIDYAANLTTSGSIEINEPKGIIIKSHTSTPYERGQLKDNGSITYNNGGSFQVMASFPQDQWHYYCIPFTQVSMNSVLPYQGIYMKYYEENLDHWKYVVSLDTNLNTMQMRGYAMYPSSTPPVHSGTVYPTGPINTGSISLTCTRSSWSGGGNNGYNLIGNPYTSSIDLENAGWSCAANVDATAYYWDGTTYQTYGWVSHAGSGPRYPAPQQAFMVHLNSGTNATVSVNHDARVVTNGTPTKDLPAIPDYIILKATANGISDDAHIIFNSNATLGFDTQLDAYKLFGVETAPNLYSRMDTIMAVNELPWTGINQVVPMGFSLQSGNDASITASNIESFKPGTRIYLEDIKEASSMHELTINPVYTFTASPKDDPNRFVLHFYNPSYGVEDKNLAGMQIYSFEDYVYVRNLVKGTTKGTIQIFDPLGRKVFQENLKDMELNKYLPGINEGYYMVRVVTSDNFYTQKIYLK